MLRLEKESHSETKAKLLFLERLFEAEKDSSVKKVSESGTQPISSDLNAKDQEKAASEIYLKQEKELQETRQQIKELHVEILKMTKTADDLTLEKNSYRYEKKLLFT